MPTLERAKKSMTDVLGTVTGRGATRLAVRWGLFGLVALHALTGCANVATGDNGSGESGAAQSKTPAQLAIEEVPFSQDHLYKLLVAEFAGRSGDFTTAVENYLEVARTTRDPNVAERAVRIAVFSRDIELGIVAATLWADIAPDSIEARQVLAALFLREGRADEATEHLARLLEQLEQVPGRGFSAIGDMLSREKDKKLAVGIMHRLVEKYADNPNATFALAHLLARVGQMEPAIELFKQVMEESPDNDRAVMLLARIQLRQGQAGVALKTLSDFLERFPATQTVRMTYGRMLVDSKRYDEARSQFERLASESPEDSDVRYALGLLLLQTSHLDKAQEQFQALTAIQARREAAYYYLGQIAEARQDPEAAVASYRQVDSGEHRLSAQIRVAVITAQLGDIAKARSHLHGLPSENSQDALRIYRAEAEILTKSDRLDEALEVYNAAAEDFPDNTDILYARAMLAEKLNRLDVLESDLRSILSREPNNADALNALGYTLADRTDRLDEALVLIQRAFDLKPEDHYVVDSLGWVMYRLGRYQEALKFLRRAQELNGDSEIAAHLGEVLWVTGDKKSAQEIWDTALKNTPDDKRILDVKKRFGL